MPKTLAQKLHHELREFKLIYISENERLMFEYGITVDSSSDRPESTFNKSIAAIAEKLKGWGFGEGLAMKISKTYPGEIFIEFFHCGKVCEMNWVKVGGIKQRPHYRWSFYYTNFPRKKFVENFLL